MLFRVTAILLALSLVAAAPIPPPPFQSQGIPGMQVVIIDHGKVTTDAAYGVKNLDTQQPVDLHTRFEIGSITKQFTAAAILQLKERGELSLDDPLGKYVPQYAAARHVTLLQLLRQVSGIPNYTNTPQFRSLITMRGTTVVLKHSGTFDAILAMIRNKPLEFKPGSKFRYSNSNYVLLGHVVEIASGMPWAQYVAKNIFARAGMHDSSFMENESQVADMATGYMMYHGHIRPAGGTTGTFNGWAGGAGAIVSTATDLAKWDAALFSGKIVSAADLRLMTAPGTVPAFSPDSHYAFGWVVDKHDGQPRIWHNGGTLGFSSSNEIYPQLGETIIALINTTAADADTVAENYFVKLNPRLAAAANRAVAGEDPAVTARAKAVFAQLASGTLDRTQFTTQMNAALTAEAVAGAKAQLSQLGTPSAWTYRGKKTAGALTTYAYRVSFGSGVALTIYMSVGADGKIAGYLLSPN
jgi:D-alanyl-D-alanine carboxypeptidase